MNFSHQARCCSFVSAMSSLQPPSVRHTAQLRWAGKIIQKSEGNSPTFTISPDLRRGDEGLQRGWGHLWRSRRPRPRPKRWRRSPQLLWASASASQWSDRGHFPPDTYHVAYPERIENVSRVSRYLAIRATCIQDVSGCIGLWIRILYVSRSLDTLRAPDTSGYILDTCIEGKLSLFRGKSQPHPCCTIRKLSFTAFL